MEWYLIIFFDCFIRIMVGLGVFEFFEILSVCCILEGFGDIVVIYFGGKYLLLILV